MKKLAIAVALVGLVATPALAAQSAKSVAPGQRMHQSGSVQGSPGASGYAPGHLKHHMKSASKFAPGHVKRTAMSRTSGKSTVGMSSTSSKTTVGSSTRSKTTVGMSKGTDAKASTTTKGSTY